ncbi:ABC transporter permease [Dinghuibacter silviterrae]|uniref:Putative ABC transport system permease protein n=1 Tax=Dinghuibacter silviterrae TaxID=1539049 RepID=A0A4R8DI38_9BACT|nr:ABC transporter permease [Dinghuibacter silviterrae]TDW97411.1 putative ABC transport system permease protein [Dinghuibacter silviterrae]
MIKNYLKMAIRNLRRHSLTSFINLSGLTIGLTCCLLILVYILHELSYDRYNRNADRIYRVTRIFYGAHHSESLHLGTVAPPFGPLLQNDFPDIQAETQVFPFGVLPMRFGEKKFNEQAAVFADENMPKVFDVTSVSGGDPAAALKEPYTVLLSETEARKYFGSDNPLNKVIRYNDQVDFKVAGVYRDFPSNAHIHPSMLLSWSSLRDTVLYGEEQLRTNFGNNSVLTYVLLPKGYPVASLVAQFPAFIDRHMKPNNDGTKASTGTELTLQKLTDIHLRSHLDFEAEENGDIVKVYIFGAIALFILLIACINYMNLATARSALRAREIGIRKTVGAGRGELILQFLAESVLIAWVAMVLALVLAYTALPYMGDLSGRTLDMRVLWGGVTVPLLVLPFLVGVLSGLYPALVLSGFKPVKVLKGFFKAGTGDLSLRKALVVLQFAISIVLIICTSVVFQQIRYMLHKPLGYDKDYTVVFQYQNELDNTYDAFRNQLLEDSRIKNVTRSSRIPTGRLLDEMGTYISENGKMEPTNLSLKYVAVDQDFIPTYGMEMKAGRNFSRAYATDSAAFVINEAAVPELGWKSPEDALGRQIRYGGQDGKIIGVMNDIYFESLHQQISPLIFIYRGTRTNFYGQVSVKISGADIPGALNHIEETYKRFIPEKAFDHIFLDQRFDVIYKAEIRQGSIFTLFAGIAIFIACLGLLGLSAFTISQRVKEIGIRKVLGAGTAGIVRLISVDFLKLVLVAALIAFPVAWYAMHRWLEGFAYRIPVHWWIFLAAGVSALLIAFVTISIQTIKAAAANPVKNLRSE